MPRVPFKPGNRFGKGRPKGSPNKKTVELNLLTRMAPFIDGSEYAANLQGRVLRGKAPHAETYLFNRLHGRPADSDGDAQDDRRPIKVVIEVVRNA